MPNRAYASAAGIVVLAPGTELVANDAVPSRLRVAARWYAEAHWAFDTHTAALALGVAFDSLVAAKDGLQTQHPRSRRPRRLAERTGVAGHELVERLYGNSVEISASIEDLPVFDNRLTLTWEPDSPCRHWRLHS